MSKLKIWLILALVLASTLSITAKVNYDQAIVYSLKNGGNLYKKACAVCHGKRADVIPPGSHARVPINNRDPYTLLVMLNTYRQGYANNGGANAIMAAALLRHKFSDEELRDIAFYVDSLEEEKEPLDEKEKQEIAKALKQGEERQAELARAEAERQAEEQRLAEAERLAQEEAERLAQEEAQKEALAQAEAQRMVEEQAQAQMQEAEQLAQATQAQNAQQAQPLSPEQQLAATEQAMAQPSQAEFASTPQETPQAQNQLTQAQQADQAQNAQMAQMAQSGAGSSNAGSSSSASNATSGSGAYADIAQLTPQQDFSESPLIAQAEQTPQYTQNTQATQIPQGQIPQQYGENAQIAQQYTQTPQMPEQLQGASSSQGTHIPPTQMQTQGTQGTHTQTITQTTTQTTTHTPQNPAFLATQTQNTQTPTHNAATSQDYIAQAEQLQGATPQGNIHTQTPHNATQGSQAMQSTQVIQGTQAYNAQSPQRATLAREAPQIIQASQTTQSPHTQIAQTIAHTPQNHITQNHLRGYYYQIAAYHGEVPKEILSQMREHDYIVYESSSNGKPLYRYLVGIYDSPQSMQKDRVQINALTKATHIQKDMKPIVRYINEHNELFVVENGKPTQKLTSITSNMANANKNKISIDITYLKNPVIKTSTPRLMPVIIKPQDINNVIKQNHILITQNDLTPIEPSSQNKTKDTKRRDNFIDLGPQVRTAEAKLPPPHSNLKSRLTIRDNQVKTNSVNMDNYIDLSIPN